MGLGNAIAPIAVKERLRRPPGHRHGCLHDGDPDRLDVVRGARGPDRRGARRLACCADRVLARDLRAARGLDRAHAAAMRRTRAGRGFPRLPSAVATAWLLVCIFALMGSAYYGLDALAPRRLRRARLERSVGRAAARDDEPDRHPGVVRGAVALRPSRRPPAVARRAERRLRHRSRRARRGAGAGVGLGAARRHRAGWPVRARDDAAARLRGRRRRASAASWR